MCHNSLGRSIDNTIMIYDNNYFAALAAHLWASPTDKHNVLSMKWRFPMMFGCTAFVCLFVYRLIVADETNVWPVQCNLLPPMKFLWALMFMKSYNTKDVYAALGKCSEKTFRKWVWSVIRAIAKLPSVSCVVVVFILIVTNTIIFLY